MSMPDVITDKAKYQQGWTGGGTETKCGFGSRLDQTVAQREWIPKVIQEYNIESIADIGAGDLNWMQHVDISCDYVALDLVPRHPKVRPFNILESVPPKVDMLLCLWVLNHFPHREARVALDNLRASGSKYLLTTYEPRMPEFLNLEHIDHIIIRKRNDERGNVNMILCEL